MGKSILVVDDTRSMRKMVVAVLQGAGYEVEEAGDGDVIRKVVNDLKSKGVSEADVTAKLSELLAQAVAQIQAGK